MQIYLADVDDDVREGIKQHALDHDRSLSWAARDLIRLGMAAKAATVQVPLVQGGPDAIRAEYLERSEASE